MEKEWELLREYMYWFIDNLKPVTVDYQLRCYSKYGYINEGRTKNYLPSFEQWKKLKTRL